MSERRDAAQPRTFYFKSANGIVKVERVLKKVEGGCGVCFAIELSAGGSSPARFVFSAGGGREDREDAG